MRKRILWGFFLVLLCAASVISQTSDQDQDAEKLKAERRSKLIAAISREAGEMILPENRALISARLGLTIWKEDPERSGTLFRNAVAGLITAQDAAEANKNPNTRSQDLVNGQSTRQQILNSIAAVDAEYALESLYRTRPITVQKALVQRSSAKLNNNGGNPMYIAQQEIAMEQRFIRLAAEQKPQKSVELLKEAIKKQLSNETLPMLKKVWEKEPMAGNDLANGVVDRLISTSFTGPNNQINFELLNLSNSVLTEFIRDRQPEEKAIAFDESRMRTLAQKVIATYIEKGPMMGYIPYSSLEPLGRRLVSPALIAQAKKAAESAPGYGHGRHTEQDPEYAKLMATNPSADTLLAEAKKFSPDMRRSMYQNAANKLSDSGQYERALALLSDQFEDDALDNAISSLNWYHAHLLVQRGDYDGAEAMMMQFNDSNRISALTQLAKTIYNKDPKENRSRANALLQRVRSLMPERPETSNDFTQLFQLINTMATIEPNDAFRNLEPVVPRINELTEAWAVVNAFQNGNIRQGEYSMAGGYNMGLYVDPSMLRTLGQNDFQRTMTIIDGLSRREMRVTILLSLLEIGI
ncbi:MAG TPA: hypothetical protein VJV05_13085 [Pyrinomonadaceae bacterium]|nr:hypothetical protein [Pyrinomonadaceae bacterium]